LSASVANCSQASIFCGVLVSLFFIDTR
jgi:hypothetical protein